MPKKTCSRELNSSNLKIEEAACSSELFDVIRCYQVLESYYLSFLKRQCYYNNSEPDVKIDDSYFFLIVFILFTFSVIIQKSSGMLHSTNLHILKNRFSLQSWHVRNIASNKNKRYV